MGFQKKSSALFIMPRSSTAWKGAEALWITVAGWAAAAERSFGEAWVLTTDRAARPAEVIHYPLSSKAATSPGSSKSKKYRIPLVLITAIKDFLLWRESRKSNHFQYTHTWGDSRIGLVWEQHDFFPGPGKKIADKLGVPFVIYVHAPQVWESAKWGVKRPLWGRFLEHLEAKALKKADIVACVSPEVAQKLAAMGVDPGKIMVSPMSVDPYLFKNIGDTSALKASLGIGDRLVIGWTGSFRSFHGLDLLVQAFAKVHAQYPQCCLLLVGDGFERADTERLVQEMGLQDAVVFAGRKSFAEIPACVSLFDIAIVSARTADGFHYSPLKLREYLAAGKATLAPRAGEIPQVFSDGQHLLLYEVGNTEDTAARIMQLVENPQLRQRLGQDGAAYVMSKGTWDYELEKVLTALNK